MGFFHFLDLSTPTAAEQHLSFDLQTLSPSRQSPLQWLPTFPTNRVPIPIEVILNIIESAYYDDQLQTDDTLLRVCSLVCKQWSAPAQRLLFRHVTLRSQHAYTAFHLAVDRATDRGRTLGDAVVRLRVLLDHNQPFGLDQHAFAHAVALCPNLYELNLSLYGRPSPGQDLIGEPTPSRLRRDAPSFDDYTLSILHSGPKISAFHFTNWSENRHSLIQLLDIWPSLRSLFLAGIPPQLPASSSPSPFPCALRELRMNFQSTPSPDFINWLLHNSSNSLRVLDLEREPTSDLLHHLLDLHTPTLESLSLPVCGSHDHALAVQKCSALKEFKVESSWVSPMVYRKLPNSLQHIALGLDGDTALQPVLDMVRTRDALSSVTVQVWDGGELHPQLPALKMACAYRGIDLRLTHDVRLFREMIRGDPVRWTSFPRTKCLENIQRMRFGG